MTRNAVELIGYADKNLTDKLSQAGLIIISRNSEGSIVANPAKVMEFFTMSQLAQIYEAGEYQLNMRKKPGF